MAEGKEVFVTSAIPKKNKGTQMELCFFFPCDPAENNLLNKQELLGKRRRQIDVTDLLL